jgi:transcriptional regulator GlxA family with amidase domain
MNLDSGFPLMGRNPVSQEMENTLNTLILFSLPHQYSAELESGAGPVPYYVRRVENFVRDNAREPLAISDLAAAAGTSTRTLHEGFRRFRNTTPMAYLRNVRLELARADLQKAGAQSVTKVALDCGFTHLSKFSLDYQRRYGERPSDTLNRNISVMPLG